MNLLFIVCIGFFLGILIASVFIKKGGPLWGVLSAVGACLVLLAASILLFQHFFAGHIEFLNPSAFFLLVLPFGIFIFYASAHTLFERLIPFPLTHLQITQESFRVVLTRWLPGTLYTMALLLLVIALARPVTVDRTVLPPTEGIDIMLLMDVSASMQKKDFYPNRFTASQQTAKRFIEKRLTDRIGVVVFAKTALLQAPLTFDHDALQEYISSMYIGMVSPDYTAIGDGLGVAANHLKDSKAKSKVIILLTDGDSNAGTIEPLLAAKAAATYGIKVYTIGTASAPDQDLYSSQTDEINEGLLMEIAQRTGGKFYRAKNEAELLQIYDTINVLEKTEFEPSTTIQRTDTFQPFLLLALAFVLLALVLEKIFLIKVP